jgi:hypothetical protein
MLYFGIPGKLIRLTKVTMEDSAFYVKILNHPLNITRGRFGLQNSLSVHNIAWLGQGTFTYEKPSY